MRLAGNVSPAESALIAAMPPGLAARLRAVIADQLAVAAAQLTDEARFVDLGADSLDHAALMNRLESEFAIRLGDDEAEGCTTLAATGAAVARALRSTS